MVATEQYDILGSNGIYSCRNLAGVPRRRRRMSTEPHAVSEFVPLSNLRSADADGNVITLCHNNVVTT